MNASQILYHSFYQLVEKNGFANITVEDILSASDVSRSTFYRHFQDKYELMTYGFKQHFEKMNFQAGVDSWEVMINDLLAYLNDYQRYFQNIIDVEGQNSIREYLLKFCINFTRETVQKLAPDIKWDFFHEESVKYTAHGGLAVTIDWIKGGYQEPIQNVTKTIFENISPILRPYLVSAQNKV